MRKLIIVILLLISLNFSIFSLSKIEVEMGDFASDGAVRIKERITFQIIGDSDKQLYDNAINRNELSFWRNITGINEIRFHIDTSKSRVEELSITPQPIDENRCNPFQKICHGGLSLGYIVSPLVDKEGNFLPNTGIFSIDKYKPRTTRYSLNKNILLFTTTDKNQSIIDRNNILEIKLPKGTKILSESDLKPLGQGMEDTEFPTSPQEIIWTNTPPTEPTLIFEIEDSLYKEVTDSFRELFQRIQRVLYGNQGFAIIVMFAILLGAYVYLNKQKKGK